MNPQILIFATNIISDPGICSAGLMHLKYPSQTTIIRVPCSSMIRPEWIVLALENGFDGVFVAADGTDCPYLKDCTERTARRVEEAQKLLSSRGIEPERVKMAAVCSVCGEAFARLIEDFYNRLRELGPVKVMKQ
ncbi:hydrogenase iron-sulfur subunit [Caldivirga sp. MU80]|jgi:coenzyme F420-reducing hydrogenase delta subunit|uniref:hydrogenase iron-sulfur subunit n=1 Tax=Caldivirga sp. MU80 TaxID=1650354 RepID=UPI00082B2799|nr:hydrogenase iron-sulfur subunit [Caldivirga sp. MU80]